MERPSLSLNSEELGYSNAYFRGMSEWLSIDVVFEKYRVLIGSLAEGYAQDIGEYTGSLSYRGYIADFIKSAPNKIVKKIKPIVDALDREFYINTFEPVREVPWLSHFGGEPWAKRLPRKILDCKFLMALREGGYYSEEYTTSDSVNSCKVLTPSECEFLNSYIKVRYFGYDERRGIVSIDKNASIDKLVDEYRGLIEHLKVGFLGGLNYYLECMTARGRIEDILCELPNGISDKLAPLVEALDTAFIAMTFEVSDHLWDATLLAGGVSDFYKIRRTKSPWRRGWRSRSVPWAKRLPRKIDNGNFLSPDIPGVPVIALPTSVLTPGEMDDDTLASLLKAGGYL